MEARALMAAQTQSIGERTLRRVASSYRKQGYRVIAPPLPDALPQFLHDCQPDLIAEREDDHVVVEVKAAGSLKGANDLVELAERVATQPGWRLELVTFKDKDPDAAVMSPQWLRQILEPTNEALTCAYRIEVVGFLLRGIALRAGQGVRDKPAVALAYELAFGGHLGEALVQRIDDAFRWQADLFRGHDLSPSAVDQAAELEKLCHALYAQSQTSED
jgi:hypothetical protein